jgi:hypothetical protein
MTSVILFLSLLSASLTERILSSDFASTDAEDINYDSSICVSQTAEVWLG